MTAEDARATNTRPVKRPLYKVGDRVTIIPYPDLPPGTITEVHQPRVGPIGPGEVPGFHGYYVEHDETEKHPKVHDGYNWLEYEITPAKESSVSWYEAWGFLVFFGCTVGAIVCGSQPSALAFASITVLIMGYSIGSLAYKKMMEKSQ